MRLQKLEGNLNEQTLSSFLSIAYGAGAVEREYRIKSFRVDFAVPSLRLAFEADDPYHERPEYQAKDSVRQAIIESLGWTVLRFSDADLKAIREELAINEVEHAC